MVLMLLQTAAQEHCAVISIVIRFPVPALWSSHSESLSTPMARSQVLHLFVKKTLWFSFQTGMGCQYLRPIPQALTPILITKVQEREVIVENKWH